MLPGKFKLIAVSQGLALPQFNNLRWPDSDVFQLRALKPQHLP